MQVFMLLLCEALPAARALLERCQNASEACFLQHHLNRVKLSHQVHQSSLKLDGPSSRAAPGWTGSLFILSTGLLRCNVWWYASTGTHATDFSLKSLTLSWLFPIRLHRILTFEYHVASYEEGGRLWQEAMIPSNSA